MIYRRIRRSTVKWTTKSLEKANLDLALALVVVLAYGTVAQGCMALTSGEGARFRLYIMITYRL